MRGLEFLKKTQDRRLCGSRTFQPGVRGIVKQNMIPLMFSGRGKPWYSQCPCPHGPWMFFFPHSPAPPSLTTYTTDPEPQGHKEGATGFSAQRGLVFAWQKMGRSWPGFPSICFGGGLLLFIWFQLLFGELRFCIQKSNLCNTLLIYCWLPRSELWEQVLNWGSSGWCFGFRQHFPQQCLWSARRGPGRLLLLILFP